MAEIKEQKGAFDDFDKGTVQLWLADPVTVRLITEVQKSVDGCMKSIIETAIGKQGEHDECLANAMRITTHRLAAFMELNDIIQGAKNYANSL